MSQDEMDDPQTYRGGAEEPGDAKGGAPGASGVPRDLVDENVADDSDEQAMSSDALGGFPDEEPSVQVPRDGGDNADATTQGDADAESPARTGSGSEANTPGRVGTDQADTPSDL
ncbi:MAG: hypothetical protein QOI73_199 [Solirubrobacteraceae bacterium]|nr:hypothetical protein [Solirubrobacteraceae bacterium]